ncbi:serine/threonine-protein kinase, partial [Streptomyces oceani]|uniref:serine/threonine-protein kinase n=1 Tax=Streptomyces oceani TaxID=1075402 RepID=UPI0009A101A5
MQPLDAGDARTIGDYRLLRRLGSGGMGRVYLGRSPGGRTVAVKVVHPHFASDDEFRARFRREVDSARRVGGDWTAPVLDADPDAPMPWVATGYVAGPTLREAVAVHGPLPESCVRAVGTGLAEALSAVHGLGLVHRDIKPSNVMLTLDGPRLIDFGVSRATDGTSVVTSAGVTVGSPGYMSPEQVLGKSTVGPPTDVFSLGAVLGYAGTGASPFPGDSSAALLYRVVHEEPELDGLPDSLRELVVGCLAKEAAERPTPADLVEGLAGPAGASGLIRTGWLPGPLVEHVSRRAVELLHLEPEAAPGAGDSGDSGNSETPSGVPSGLVPFTHGSRSPEGGVVGAADSGAAAEDSAADGGPGSAGRVRTGAAGEVPSAARGWPMAEGAAGFGPPDPSYGMAGGGVAGGGAAGAGGA